MVSDFVVFLLPRWLAGWLVFFYPLISGDDDVFPFVPAAAGRGVPAEVGRGRSVVVACVWVLVAHCTRLPSGCGRCWVWSPSLVSTPWSHVPSCTCPTKQRSRRACTVKICGLLASQRKQFSGAEETPAPADQTSQQPALRGAAHSLPTVVARGWYEWLR